MPHVEIEVVDAAPGMVISGIIVAVEFVLDAEVIQLIEHVVRLVRQLPQHVQLVLERGVGDVPAMRGVEYPLRMKQLPLEGADVGAETVAGRPVLQQAIRNRGQRLAYHPNCRTDGRVHPQLLTRVADKCAQDR